MSEEAALILTNGVKVQRISFALLFTFELIDITKKTRAHTWQRQRRQRGGRGKGHQL